MRIVWIDPVNCDAQFLNVLALALNEYGNQVTVCSNAREGHPPPSTVNWVPFSSIRSFPRSLEGRQFLRLAVGTLYPWDWGRAIRFAREQQVRSVLISTNLRVPIVDTWALRALRLSGIEPVVIVHRPYPLFYENRERRGMRWYRDFFWSASRLLTLTDYIRNLLIELFDLPLARFGRFPFPHYNAIFSEVQMSELLFDELRAWAAGSPVVLYISSAVPEHGLEVFAQSWQYLRSLVPGIKALLVFSTADRSYWKPIEANLSDMVTNGEVRIRQAAYSYPELLAYMKTASAVVLPYNWASQSSVIPLAAGLGVPAIATNVGGLPELIAPGVSGELVPPRDPKALAEAVAQVFVPERLSVYRQGASELAEAAFSPAKASEAICQALESAVQAARRSDEPR